MVLVPSRHPYLNLKLKIKAPFGALKNLHGLHKSIAFLNLFSEMFLQKFGEASRVFTSDT